MSYKKFARRWDQIRYRTALGGAPAMALFLIYVLTPLKEVVPGFIIWPLFFILFLVGGIRAFVSLCKEDLERNMIEQQKRMSAKSDADD